MSDKYVTVGVSAMDVAAYLAEQAIMRGLAPYGWRAVFHGWVKANNGYRVEVQIEPPPAPAPEPAPEPPPQKRYCWECRWGMLSKAADQCWAPALCGEDYVRGAKQPQLGCPANATGDCKCWEAKDGAH
jgi:hypothetical protein